MHRNLKITLIANALFSGVSGLFMILLPDWFAGQVGLTQSLLILCIGIGLVVFAGYVLFTSVKGAMQNVTGIISGDIAWVVGSLVALILFWTKIPASGRWLVDIIAIIVGLFAYFQYRYWKLPAN